MPTTLGPFKPVKLVKGSPQFGLIFRPFFFLFFVQYLDFEIRFCSFFTDLLNRKHFLAVFN